MADQMAICRMGQRIFYRENCDPPDASLCKKRCNRRICQSAVNTSIATGNNDSTPLYNHFPFLFIEKREHLLDKKMDLSPKVFVASKKGYRRFMIEWRSHHCDWEIFGRRLFTNPLKQTLPQ